MRLKECVPIYMEDPVMLLLSTEQDIVQRIVLFIETIRFGRFSFRIYLQCMKIDYISSTCLHTVLAPINGALDQ